MLLKLLSRMYLQILSELSLVSSTSSPALLSILIYPTAHMNMSEVILPLPNNWFCLTCDKTQHPCHSPRDLP